MANNKKSVFIIPLSILLAVICIFVSISQVLSFSIFGYQNETEERNCIISERLEEVLKSSSDEISIPVMIWFRNFSRPKIQSELLDLFGYSDLEWKKDIAEKSSLAEIREYKKEKAKVASSIYSVDNATIVTNHLSKFNISYISRYSPVVIASSTKQEIYYLASKTDVVESIDYYEGDKVEICSSPTDEMIATRTTLAKNTYNVDGTGIKVGVVDMSVPYLSEVPGNGLPSGVSYSVAPNGILAHGSTHATLCGSIIATVAPGAELFFAASNNAVADIEWLIDQCVDIISISLSIGGQTNNYTDYSRWYDHIEYEHFVTVCIAAGNKGDSTTSPTSGSGATTGIFDAQMAYNVITVGAMGFNNTPSNYSDDYIMPKTSYSSNSSFSHPYKPEISTYFGDTSQATALTSGIVALMMDAKYSLTAYPEAIKAIISASVNKSVTHKYLPKNRNLDPQVDSYLRYGAGVIDANEAIALALDGRYKTYGFDDDEYYWVFSLPTTAYSTLRVSLAFLQTSDVTGDHNNWTGVSNYSTVDLDLFITDSNNNWVTYSATKNNVEIVEFSPDISNTYSVKIHQYNHGSSDHIVWCAVAWD